MRTLLLAVIIIVFGSYKVKSQDTTVTKRNVVKIFKDNANGTTFNWKKRNHSNGANSMHHSKYNSWISCNEDSMFDKSDTIKLYNHNLFYLNWNCEMIREWTILSKNEILTSDSKPPMSITKPSNSFKIIKNKSNVILQISSNRKIIENYIVLDLGIDYKDFEKTDKCYTITLKRIKTGYYNIYIANSFKEIKRFRY